MNALKVENETSSWHGVGTNPRVARTADVRSAKPRGTTRFPFGHGLSADFGSASRQTHLICAYGRACFFENRFHAGDRWVHPLHITSEGRSLNVGLIVLVLLLALLFGGLGFAAHALWIIAVLFAVFWLAGFAFRRGEGRWYRW